MLGPQRGFLAARGRWAYRSAVARSIAVSGSWRDGGGLLLRALPGLSPAFLVVALLACVLVPLPTGLVDLLLSLSLSGAVLLLVASLRIRRTTDFLGFPSLLLLVTLFRLALNLSTTRLILSQADAGRVIDAFAGFVVRDDLVVGVVMFAIITLVQFLVIARGAERVAEVGARFALDGLPGHQAAIDADLRAGVISAREAAGRRAALTERSNFYGAMDGAVRFVKGDAVAGLAITAVNLLGGLAIGVGRRELPVAESLDLYGRLTIGDGLLAQIPALLVSLAAGVLVARVDREEDGVPGRALPWLDPAMLLVPAALLMALAAVPRMPSLAFLTAAGALVASALVLSRRAAGARERPRVRPTQLDLRAASLPSDSRALAEALADLRQRLTNVLGLEAPPLRAHRDPSLPPGTIELAGGARALGRVVARCEDLGELVVAGYRLALARVEGWVDLELLDRALAQARREHPAVVAEAMGVVSTVELLAIVQALARERVPVGSITVVLAALAEDPRQREDGAARLRPELVRLRLAPSWVHRLLEGLGSPEQVAWVRAEPDLEAWLCERRSGDEVRLSVSERARLRAGLMGRVGSRRPVLVATARARSAVAAAFRDPSGQAPHVPVLSRAELARAGVQVPEGAGWLPHPDEDDDTN